jgi:hypothetical protein
VVLKKSILRISVNRCSMQANSPGTSFDNGYGKIKNKSFHFPHMADITQADLDELFQLLKNFLPVVRN